MLILQARKLCKCHDAMPVLVGQLMAPSVRMSYELCSMPFAFQVPITFHGVVSKMPDGAGSEGANELGSLLNAMSLSGKGGPAHQLQRTPKQRAVDDQHALIERLEVKVRQCGMSLERLGSRLPDGGAKVRPGAVYGMLVCVIVLVSCIS